MQTRDKISFGLGLFIGVVTVLFLFFYVVVLGLFAIVLLAMGQNRKIIDKIFTDAMKGFENVKSFFPSQQRTPVAREETSDERSE